MMLRWFRIVLVALLWGSVAYGVAAVYGMLSRVGGCMGLTIGLTPQCVLVLRHAAGPGRLEVLVALGCVAASLLAATISRLPGGTSSRWARTGRLLIPVIVSLLVVLIAGLFDSAFRSGGNAVVTAVMVLLVWLGTRDLAQVWTELGIDPASHGSYEAPALHRLRLRILAVIALSIALAVAAEWLVSRAPFGLVGAKALQHIHVESVLLAAGLTAGVGMLLLVTAQHVAVHREWAGDEVLGRQRAGMRWLAACAALALLAISVAVVAPPASTVVTNLARAALAPLFGAAPHVVNVHLDCRTDKRYCVTPKKLVKRPKHHQGATATRKPPSLQTRILGTLIWLLALGLLLYGWIGRSVSRRRRLVQFLRAIWEVMRRARRRAALMVESLLPDQVLELASPLARGHLRSVDAGSRRKQIVRYYVDAVAHAGRHGIVRRSSQTPEDFAAIVRRRLESGGDAWTALTADYIAARYSPRDPSDAEVSRVRALWQQVRRALRAVTGDGSVPRSGTPH